MTVTVLVPAPAAAAAPVDVAPAGSAPRPRTSHPATHVTTKHPTGSLATTGLSDLVPALAMTAVVVAVALRPRRRRS